MRFSAKPIVERRQTITGRPRDGADDQALALGLGREEIDRIAMQAFLHLEDRDVEGAASYLSSLKLPSEAFTAVWNQFESHHRTALTKHYRGKT